MNKTQEQTLEILKALVEKQKKAIGKKDEEISKLTDRIFKSEEVEELNEKIECLEGRILDEGEIAEIKCGIGIIRYNIPSNIQLVMLMESLESAITKQGTLFVLEALNILS